MRRTLTNTIGLTLGLLLPLAGCEDHTEGAAPAVVEPAAANPRGGDPAGEAAAADPGAAEQSGREASTAEQLSVDTERSTLGFTGAKVSGSHEGHFDEWSGTFELRPDSIEDSSVSITIQMASVQADRERLTGHLRTDDFFDVERFPTATFESTRIAPAPGGTEDATHLVSGRLTLRGHTETITFPANISVSDEEARATARFTIDRQLFGISYAGMEDDLIRDEVVIHFDVRAPRDGEA